MVFIIIAQEFGKVNFCGRMHHFLQIAGSLQNERDDFAV